jgi:lipopolysaccharide export system protein LptA
MNLPQLHRCLWILAAGFLPCCRTAETNPESPQAKAERERLEAQDAAFQKAREEEEKKSEKAATLESQRLRGLPKTIAADEVVFAADRKSATYRGHVRLRSENLDLDCTELRVIFTDAAPEAEKSLHLSRFTATGEKQGVRLVLRCKIHDSTLDATGCVAEFDNNQQTLCLKNGWACRASQWSNRPSADHTVAQINLANGLVKTNGPTITIGRIDN